MIITDADITDGYVPTPDTERRTLWENGIKQNLIDMGKNGFGFSEAEAENVLREIQGMDVKDASEYLESNYGYYNAEYGYEDLALHRGTTGEINNYIKSKLSKHRFSYYFAKKFTDFAGLHMGFFATILLAFLFMQDTRKSTYELLHTKPVTAAEYVCGKAAGGFCTMLGVLGILNIVFYGSCMGTAIKSGFSMNPLDFIVNSLLYIVPNMLMICCVCERLCMELCDTECGRSPFPGSEISCFIQAICGKRNLYENIEQRKARHKLSAREEYCIRRCLYLSDE